MAISNSSLIPSTWMISTSPITEGLGIPVSRCSDGCLSHFGRLFGAREVWALSFLACYLVSLHALGTNQALLDFWRNYFPPQSLWSWKNFSLERKILHGVQMIRRSSNLLLGSPDWIARRSRLLAAALPLASQSRSVCSYPNQADLEGCTDADPPKASRRHQVSHSIRTNASAVWGSLVHLSLGTIPVLVLLRSL